MADYWKSQARKYCDFCKCWIADNKPSIQYHENGKRHKENVAKKLSTLAKHSAKQHKQNVKLDGEMKKMEEEAMKAYMKDIESKADYSSSMLNEKMEQEKEAEDDTPKELRKASLPDKRQWIEAKSPEGHTYYWNSVTNESVWEAPKEGYISMEEQNKAAKVKELEAEGEKKLKDEELRAWKAREEMKKKYRKQEEPPPSGENNEEESNKKRKKKEKKTDGGQLGMVGPQPRANPYGAWTTVQPKIIKPIDLQLPKVKPKMEIKVVSLHEPKMEVVEKKVESLGDDAPCAFKKRKFNRSNMRQRLDDVE